MGAGNMNTPIAAGVIGGQRGLYAGWHALLPYMEQQPLFQQIETAQITPWAGQSHGGVLVDRYPAAFLANAPAMQVSRIHRVLSEPTRSAAMHSASATTMLPRK